MVWQTRWFSIQLVAFDNSSNLSDHVSQALEVIELVAEYIFTIRLGFVQDYCDMIFHVLDDST